MQLRDYRDSRKRLSIDNFCLVSVGLRLDNPKFSSLKESQSRQLTNSGSQIVSVSTNPELLSLKKSRSQQLLILIFSNDFFEAKEYF